jgi:hypothetical protein
MPEWLKILLVVGGLIGSNGVTNGIQFTRVTQPAEARSEARNAYAEGAEDRLYTCSDRLAECQDELYKCRER